MSATPIRWGILGPGKIAQKFASGLQTLEDATLTAIGTRDPLKAISFSTDFQVPNVHLSYDSMVADPEVDIVYVATPHTFHLEHTLLALEAGKHVLCEKPLARNAAEANLMAQKAREKGLFLMEAMWTRYLPLWQWLKPELDNGLIGEVRMVQADFGFNAPFDPEDRKFNPELAGGALLDVGIYPVSLACWLLGGKPVSITAKGTLGTTGVDEENMALLSFANGKMAQVTSAVSCETPKQGWIMGTEGVVQIPMFWRATEAIVHRPNHHPLYMKMPFESSGLQFQAQYAMDCLREGRTASVIQPMSESLMIMEVLDEIRKQIGVVYPGE